MMLKTEEVLTQATDLLQNWVWSSEAVRPEPNRLDVFLEKSEDLVPMAVGLRVRRLGYLAAITGLDLGQDESALELLYHFCTGDAVVTLRVRLPRDNPVIHTLCEIVPSAEPFEREVSEMFGVTFQGLKEPIRLYLPDEWPEGVFPLRKDFHEEDLDQESDKEPANGN